VDRDRWLVPLLLLLLLLLPRAAATGLGGL
jgi:hypothetical protein